MGLFDKIVKGVLDLPDVPAKKTPRLTLTETYEYEEGIGRRHDDRARDVSHGHTARLPRSKGGGRRH